MITRMRPHFRTFLLLVAALVFAFASPVGSAYAVTTESGAVQLSPGNTNNGDSVLELAKQCLRMYLALPRTTNGVQGATDEQVRAVSEICHRAIEASGLSSADFWAKYRPLIDAGDAKPTVPTSNLDELIRECVARVARAGKAGASQNDVVDQTRVICNRAIELSGLTAEEFWAKYGEKEKPDTRPADASPLSVLSACVRLAAELTADSTSEQANRAGEACRKAIAAH